MRPVLTALALLFALAPAHAQVPPQIGCSAPMAPGSCPTTSFAGGTR